MDRTIIFNKVCSILQKEYDISDASISYDTNFRDVLGIDSMDIASLAICLEECFIIDINDDELYNCNVINDVIELIYNKLEKK